MLNFKSYEVCGMIKMALGGKPVPECLENYLESTIDHHYEMGKLDGKEERISTHLTNGADNQTIILISRILHESLGNKITAIKITREVLSLGLKEAKDFVERYFDFVNESDGSSYYTNKTVLKTFFEPKI